jgi:hypothetical protein
MTRYRVVRTLSDSLYTQKQTFLTQFFKVAHGLHDTVLSAYKKYANAHSLVHVQCHVSSEC